MCIRAGLVTVLHFDRDVLRARDHVYTEVRGDVGRRSREHKCGHHVIEDHRRIASISHRKYSQCGL
jgi:hypothetical protein